MHTKSQLAWKMGAFSLSFISLFPAIYCLLQLSNMGFPDGHLTEYDQINQKLYPAYIGISALFVIVFFYFGRNIQTNNKPKKIIWTSLLFAVFILLMFLLDQYFYTHLDHGQGG